MAKYTIELRKICEIYGRDEVESWFKDYDIADYLLPKQLELVSNTNVWNKDRLAKKIVDHYYMREIGLETPALFKHYAKVLMNEIMEEKLPIIYTIAMEYDPLINVNYTETFNRTTSGEAQNEGEASSSSSSSNDSLGIVNNTPETNITKQNLENGLYASQVNQGESSSSIEDSTSTSNSSSTSGTETFIRNLKGNQGITATYQMMLKQFRNNVRAIDTEIIKELNNLFMGLY